MANEFQEVKVETPLSIIDCGGVATICSGRDWGHVPLDSPVRQAREREQGEPTSPHEILVENGIDMGYR